LLLIVWRLLKRITVRFVLLSNLLPYRRAVNASCAGDQPVDRIKSVFPIAFAKSAVFSQKVTRLLNLEFPG
jgi:hypothetical protein